MAQDSPSCPTDHMSSTAHLTCQICGRVGPGVALCSACAAIATCQDRHRKRTKQHSENHECERMQLQMANRVGAPAGCCLSHSDRVVIKLDWTL